ncbi:hypothetical protein GQ42DRAFT_147283 [Ramicandelaber brevisporus]|nr:hypothetical protein GQ42DRAFT_147283 [Ramicandelaber brevisporus]
MSKLKYPNQSRPFSKSAAATVVQPDLSNLFHSSLDAIRGELIQAGCNAAHVTSQWVGNHIFLIVWKLASTVQRQPQFVDLTTAMQPAASDHTHPLYWSEHNVIQQLLYRFEAEFNRGWRSVFSRITVGDDTASRPMVLCIVSINLNSGDEQCATATVTDGWYILSAKLDPALTGFAQSGRLRVGTKLLVSNAKLVGCENGVPVLEATKRPDVCLLLSANSCRVCRWDMTFGAVRFECSQSPATANLTSSKGTVQGVLDKTRTVLPSRRLMPSAAGIRTTPTVPPTPLPRHPPISILAVPLRSILRSGGIISAVDIVIWRIFDGQFLETMPDGSKVVRSKSDELMLQRVHAESRRKLYEELIQARAATCRLAHRFASSSYSAPFAGASGGGGSSNSASQSDDSAEDSAVSIVAEVTAEVSSRIPNREVVPFIRAILVDSSSSAADAAISLRGTAEARMNDIGGLPAHSVSVRLWRVSGSSDDDSGGNGKFCVGARFFVTNLMPAASAIGNGVGQMSLNTMHNTKWIPLNPL